VFETRLSALRHIFVARHARVLRAVHGAAARLPGPALVVTHGGAMRALLAALPSPAGVPERIPNAGVVRLSLTAGAAVRAEWIE
jgi:probable phosphoglycerate mutase